MSIAWLPDQEVRARGHPVDWIPAPGSRDPYNCEAGRSGHRNAHEIITINDHYGGGTAVTFDDLRNLAGLQQRNDLH